MNSEATVEFNCILDNSSQEIRDKIPAKFIDFMRSIESTTYKFNYDSNKSLNEQDILPETRGIISFVYQDYICNEEEKKKYIDKCNNYKIKKENELREKYNPNKIFEKRNQNSINNKSIEENAMVEYREKSVFRKIFDKIKSLFEEK